VPLFAPEEIWDELEMPGNYSPGEIIEVAATGRDETALAVIG
jgi:hypothetical protein